MEFTLLDYIAAGIGGLLFFLLVHSAIDYIRSEKGDEF